MADSRLDLFDVKQLEWLESLKKYYVDPRDKKASDPEITDQEYNNILTAGATIWEKSESESIRDKTIEVLIGFGFTDEFVSHLLRSFNDPYGTEKSVLEHKSLKYIFEQANNYNQLGYENPHGVGKERHAAAEAAEQEIKNQLEMFNYSLKNIYEVITKLNAKLFNLTQTISAAQVKSTEVSRLDESQKMMAQAHNFRIITGLSHAILQGYNSYKSILNKKFLDEEKANKNNYQKIRKEVKEYAIQEIYRIMGQSKIIGKNAHEEFNRIINANMPNNLNPLPVTESLEKLKNEKYKALIHLYNAAIDNNESLLSVKEKFDKYINASQQQHGFKTAVHGLFNIKLNQKSEKSETTNKKPKSVKNAEEVYGKLEVACGKFSNEIFKSQTDQSQQFRHTNP